MRHVFFTLSLVAVTTALAGMSANDGNAQPTNIDVGNFYFCSAPFENGVCETTVASGSGCHLAGISRQSHNHAV